MSSKLYSPKTKSFQKCKHVNPKLQKPVFQENLGHTVKPTRWGKKTWQQMRHEWISLAAIFKLYLFIKLFCFKCSSNLIFCRFQTNFSQFGQFFVFTATANPRQKWNLPSDKSIQFWHFFCLNREHGIIQVISGPPRAGRLRPVQIQLPRHKSPQ